MCLNTFLKILVCLFVDLENKKPALRLVLTRNKQLRYSVKHLECINFEVDEITFIPQVNIEIDDEEVIANFDKFINMLEDCDDVQNVYHNAIIKK